MDFMHDFGCGLLMLFVAFMVFDWARIWWYARRYGRILVPRYLYKGQPPTRWEAAYLGYKVWTWLVYLAAIAVSAWHLSLALLWFVELAFAVAVS